MSKERGVMKQKKEKRREKGIDITEKRKKGAADERLWGRKGA